MTEVETFGDVLRRLRQSRGLLLRELAARLDLSVAYLSEVERGDKGALSILPTLAAGRSCLATREELVELVELSIKERKGLELSTVGVDPRINQTLARLALDYHSGDHETLRTLIDALDELDKARG